MSIFWKNRLKVKLFCRINLIVKRIHENFHRTPSNSNPILCYELNYLKYYKKKKYAIFAGCKNKTYLIHLMN